MDEENVFSQLRRIARNVQNESALAQERMSRPLPLRSSGDSARPVLRRMQADAHNVKLAAGEAQSNLPSTSEFNKLLESCSQLCDAYRSKVNILEGYLQQYGYQPQPIKGAHVDGNLKKEQVKAVSQQSKGEQVDTSDNDAEEMKENIPTTPTNKPDLGSSWKGGTPRLEDFGLSRGFLEQIKGSKHQNPKEQQPTTEKPQPRSAVKINPATPFKKPDVALPVAGGTPKLEDFGLSTNFLEKFSKSRVQVQHGAGSTQEGAHLTSTYNTKQMGMAYTPMHHNSDASACPFTPVGVTTTPGTRVTVTPGMFGGSEMPDETPTRFIDLASGLPRGPQTSSANDSSRPHGVKKSLHYTPSGKKGGMSVLDNLAENEDQFGTPQPPELTARWDFTSVQAALPTQPDYTLGSEKPPPQPEMLPLAYQTDTPPTPEMTAKWNTRITSKAPDSLLPPEPSFIMEEPIRLTSHEPQQTPEEPQRLYIEKPAPSINDMPETPPGLSGNVGNSKTFDFSRFLPDEMPKTPELTMSYARYVDPGTKAANVPTPVDADNVPQYHSANLHPSNPLPAKVEQSNNSQNSSDITYISMVTDDEFSKQSAHMRRILPLTLVNETISYMNTILNIKNKQGEGVYMTDEDVPVLGLGPKSKAMLLFFITMKRLSSGKRPGTSEVAYYPTA